MNTLTIAVMVVVQGWASQYSPGVMQEVIHNRTGGMPSVPQLDQVPSLPGIATADCGDLGRTRRIRYEGQGWESAVVVDCPRPGDGTQEWMLENGILLEMSHQRAAELGTVGRGIRVEMVTIETREVRLDWVFGPALV